VLVGGGRPVVVESTSYDDDDDELLVTLRNKLTWTHQINRLSKEFSSLALFPANGE